MQGRKQGTFSFGFCLAFLVAGREVGGIGTRQEREERKDIAARLETHFLGGITNPPALGERTHCV